jgi:hypothetical protein
MDRDGALQRLRRLPACLHLRGNRLVNHGPEAYEPNEEVATLTVCEDAFPELLSRHRREAMVIAWG